MASAPAGSVSAAGTLLEERAAWQRRLDASLDCLRTLLSPAQRRSKAWRPVPMPPTSAAIQQLQGTQQHHASTRGVKSEQQHTRSSSVASTSRHRLDDASFSPLLPLDGTVQVSRRTAKRNSRDDDAMHSGASLLPPGSSTNADIYRATCRLPIRGDADTLSADDVLTSVRSLLATPECRPLWDDMVEESCSIEELDAATRVTRTIFKLGWPASQRDAITISRTLKEGSTLIDVSTSLPRSPDAPAYLRPAPPYIRSHVNLFAWCLERSHDGKQPAFKLTVFWSWDLRGAWLGMPAGGLGVRLPQMVSSLVKHVRQGDASRVPSLVSFGNGIEVTQRSFDLSRDLLSIQYQVIAEDNDAILEEEDVRLQWALPAAEGWDVHVTIRPFEAGQSVEPLWHSHATQAMHGIDPASSLLLTVEHDAGTGMGQKGLLISGLRGEVTIQRIAASQDVRLRVNDAPQDVESVSPSTQPGLDKSLLAISDDAASVSGISLQSEGSSAGAEDLILRASTPVNGASRNGSVRGTPDMTASPSLAHPRPVADRTQAIGSIVRRNYIYFTSLLQEPEQKWKAYSDARGVTISQLDSIDPTLVVYRAEATFVGVTTWDLFAAIGNPGVKSTWDKGVEESSLIQDVGDTSRVWWTKTKGVWPVSNRDAVLLETSYKSPNSIHLFAFSIDDRKMFPAIPATGPATIRTQTDLRGWSIESLSPTTVHVTLIEQSDPKGWTSKSAATPAAMTAAVAGVGDFVIKNGSPPIVTRLLGARLRQMKYEHDKGTFRVEYDLTSELRGSDDGGNVECEIRCDVETWGPSVDMVIDPPPINVSCLRRHKLSPNGSGLWLTIEQPIASLEDETSRITVRRAASKERGVVSVNGARIRVDVDELSEEEVATLKETKRGKPKRVPLDLVRSVPTRPMMGSSPPSTPMSRTGTPAPSMKSAAQPMTAPAATRRETNDVFSDEKPRQPMTCALDVLFLLRRIHAERSPDPAGNPAGWLLLSQRNGLFVRRKLMHSISPTIAVQRSDKVVEGLTAEDLLHVVESIDCRRVWDDKVESTKLLESYANGASTSFFTTKASFPFRGRGFHLASLTARSGPTSSHVGTPSQPSAFFHATASYPEQQSSFASDKVNPMGLPIGRVLIDGWILETLDPYSSTLNYQIPSTRVTHLLAIDYAGSIPVAVNAVWNTQMARAIVAIEEYVKARGALPEIRRPPSCFEVRGDARDDDPDLIWTLEDDSSARTCTLLSTSFSSSTRVASVLMRVESRTDDAVQSTEVTTPLAVPFPRRPNLLDGEALNGSSSDTAFQRATDTEPVETLVDQSSAEPSGIPRAVSTSSIRSATLKTRPSINRLNSKTPKDLILADLEVDLRHYPDGYDVVPSSEYLATSISRHNKDGEKAAETSGAVMSEQATSATEDKQQDIIALSSASAASQALPIIVTAFDMPPSAVLAATLDPSLRPKKHLIRLTLPTSVFADAREDVLQGPELDNAPEWFDDLRKRGAAVRLTIRPHQRSAADDISPVHDALATSSENHSDTDHEVQDIQVYVDKKRIKLVHVNQTSAMLQRESDNKDEYAALDRILPSNTSKIVKVHGQEKEVEDRLPTLLRMPVAVAVNLQKDKATKDASSDDVKTPNAVRTNAATITPSSSLTNAVHDPKTPTPGANGAVPQSLTTPVLKSSAAAVTSSTSAASAQIMNILNSYPLSRLGASTAVSTTVANGGLFSRKGLSEDGGQARAADGSPIAEEATKDSTPADGEQSALQAMPGQLIAQTEQLRRRLVDVRFGLSTLIFVALIAFLFGSLVRSLLAPADFVLVDQHGGAIMSTLRADPASMGGRVGSSHRGEAVQAAAMSEVRKMLESRHGAVRDSPSAGTDVDIVETLHAPTPPGTTPPGVTWRELKRLVEVRNIFGLQWDFVVAAARRQ